MFRGWRCLYCWRMPECRSVGLHEFFMCFFENKLKGSLLSFLCGSALSPVAAAMCVYLAPTVIPCCLNVLCPLFGELGYSLGAALPSYFSHPSSQLLCVEWAELDCVCVCFQCNVHLSFRPPWTCWPFGLQLQALHCMQSPQVIYPSPTAIALALMSKCTECVLESPLLPMAITLADARQAYASRHMSMGCGQTVACAGSQGLRCYLAVPVQFVSVQEAGLCVWTHRGWHSLLACVESTDSQCLGFFCRAEDFWQGYKLFSYAYYSHSRAHEAEFLATKLG